jgi:hypothetical protein
MVALTKNKIKINEYNNERYTTDNLIDLIKNTTEAKPRANKISIIKNLGKKVKFTQRKKEHKRENNRSFL